MTTNFDYNARTAAITTTASTSTYITNTTTSLSILSSSPLLSKTGATTLSSPLQVLQPKLNTGNSLANGFLIENSNMAITKTELHDAAHKTLSSPPLYHDIPNTLHEMEKKTNFPSTPIAANSYLQQQKLLESKPELTSETILNDKNEETPSDAYGPAIAINEPQKPRWLSSLHSVIFIITCALAVFIVFRNVLTW